MYQWSIKHRLYYLKHICYKYYNYIINIKSSSGLGTRTLA